MTGTQTFDSLAEQRNSQHSNLDESGAWWELGEQMVAGAIASGKMLRNLRHLMFPKQETSSTMAVAKALQADFQQWADEADAIYDRGLKLRRAGSSIPQLEELRDLVGLTRAMLTITPEDHMRTLQEPGRIWSMEELRRELGLPPKR